MNRAIAGFHQDEAGEWVAELSCLHGQHVRHERAARVGSALDCPLCDRAELPGGLEVVRTTDVWEEQTLPAALTRAHRIAVGTWGQLRVVEGRLRFLAATQPPLDVIVVPESPQPIPPEVEHHVEPLGEVRFFVEFLRR